ncbi:MAG: hypothetical protein ACTSQE_14520 [Candidatus Heimdallarchaeaceae archaeon]
MTIVATKLQKKTLQLIDEVNIIIREIPVKMTLRQIWYQIISKRIMVKNKSNYKKVSRDVVKGRRAGLIPTDKIIDPERHRDLREYWYQTAGEFFEYKTSYESLKDYLTNYYVHMWHKQPEFIEVWTEKGALVTLFEPIIRKYGVSFVVCKGYASYTILLESAKRIKEECKIRKKERCTILYFGDYDPSGKRIVAVIQNELTNLGTSINLIEVAVKPSQIEQYNVPLIPLKKTDKNFKWFMQEYGEFGEKGCELDALKADILQGIIEQAILEHFNQEIYKQVEAERQEEIKHMIVEAEKLLSKIGV